jgi:hypothetical protein
MLHAALTEWSSLWILCEMQNQLFSYLNTALIRRTSGGSLGPVRQNIIFRISGGTGQKCILILLFYATLNSIKNILTSGFCVMQCFSVINIRPEFHRKYFCTWVSIYVLTLFCVTINHEGKYRFELLLYSPEGGEKTPKHAGTTSLMT